jgi:hypothetical protein
MSETDHLHDDIDTPSDLHDAMIASLDRRGVLGQIKSRIRAEVFHTIEDKSIGMPEKPKEIFLAGELIREFLMSSSLNSSLSVFNEEIGQPNEMNIDREFIGGELGFNMIDEKPQSQQVPLLVLLVNQLLGERKKANLDNDLSTEVHLDDM